MQERTHWLYCSTRGFICHTIMSGGRGISQDPEEGVEIWPNFIFLSENRVILGSAVSSNLQMSPEQLLSMAGIGLVASISTTC